jgi:Family of unknown function (DUF6064)
MLPFSREQFLAVFVSYNQSIWPVQVLAYLIGIVAVMLLFRPGAATDRLVGSILAVFWIWTGIVYHCLFFSEINKAAYLFGALFVAQGFCLAIAGMLQRRPRFGFRRSPRQWIGIAFVVYATVAYPMIGALAGHAYVELPMFGVTPCPVTIFTFGVLLLATNPVPRLVFVIPFAWSLIGGSAPVLLSIPQDWLLLVSGLISIPLIVLSERNASSMRGT